MPLSAPSAGTGTYGTARPTQAGYALTGEQETIVAAATNRSIQRVVVKALAGTGKTSTCVEIANRQIRQPMLYLAFNKSVQMEAARRFPEWVDVRTAHSVAYQAIGKLYGHRLPGNPEASRMPAKTMASRMRVKAARLDTGTLNPVVITRMAQATVLQFMKTADPELGPQHIPGRVLELHDRDAIISVVMPVAEKIWADLTHLHGKFRYTPDVYLKQWQLTNPRIAAEQILFDEAQDADPVIASVVAAQSARLTYVGDENQAIYGWRGAVDALSQVQDAVHCPLTKSFRFGPAIAEAANGWLRILGSPLRVVGHDPVKSEVRPLRDNEAPRAILCRGNGTALGWVLAFLQRGIKVALAPGDKNAGKEISRFAWAAKDLMNGEGTDHPDLVGFSTWAELCTFVEEEEDTDDLKRLVGIINRVGVSQVIDAIKGLSLEQDAQITVSTAHKAKGLEWDSVKVADDFAPREDKETGEPIPPSTEDYMLNYVTVTRAKRLLIPGPLDVGLWS